MTRVLILTEANKKEADSRIPFEVDTLHDLGWPALFLTAAKFAIPHAEKSLHTSILFSSCKKS